MTTIKRFGDDTTIREFLDAVEPLLEPLLEDETITAGQECLGAACAFANLYPESQTARELLAWGHGSTPCGCVENARAETPEEWIAEEDMAAFEAIP